nr:winged helix-turn-helix domain-containing protein [Streptomyces sp. WM6386]
MIDRVFHVSYTLQGTRRLLRRHSRSWQQPARRAIERDDTAIEWWTKNVWPWVEAPRRRSVPGASSRTRRPGDRRVADVAVGHLVQRVARRELHRAGRRHPSLRPRLPDLQRRLRGTWERRHRRPT